MKKKKKIVGGFLQVRELTDQAQQKNDRVLEIYDVAEREKRELTDKEQEEVDRLGREVHNIEQRLRALTLDLNEANPNLRQQAEQIIRDNAQSNIKTEIVFVRDLMMVGDVASGGLVPLNVQDILKPLEEGLLLYKLGLPMPTGLSGEFVWPLYEMIEATVAGEGVALADSKIPFSKLTASPERVGAAVPVTHQSINQSNGVIEMVVTEVMPRAIAKLLNKVLLSRKKVNASTNLAGPFVDMEMVPEKLSAIPTAAELAAMKAKVLETGIEGDALCWTMTNSMAAQLEVTPINEKGVFIPMLQNGMLLGLPVFTSNVMRDADSTYKKWDGAEWQDHELGKNDIVHRVVTSTDDVAKPKAGAIYEIQERTEFVGLGDWRYQPMGLFGQIRFIVDPYSKARQDAVDFVINADYATKTLRPEAFLLGEVSKA